ncbi:MAG TPA: glycosyltransferase family 39 protein [Candidatus Binataceae bacterium]|nr:glycosyltransferase family 39 protein [Candidatus Binataceae bacterium]
MAEEASSAAREKAGAGIVATRAADRHFPIEVLAAVGVVALAALIFFFHLGAYGFWEPDEARYGEIAREMLAARDYIVPHLNYVAYVEKPPLLYWLTTLSFRAFGINEFAARLVPAGAAMLGVLATLFFTARAMGLRRAVLAGAILATAPLYAGMAQVLTTDMLLTAFVTIAILALFLHHREGGIWCWIAYLAMAAATLTKGPVGIVLPALAMVIFLWREHALADVMRRFHVIAGGVLVFTIVAPWFIAISIRAPGFVDFYFIGEHLRRVFDSSFSHGEPFYFYIPVIIGGLLPWSLLMPFLTWRRMAPNPARRWCAIAAGIIFAIFSLSSGKLIPYILPAFPPLAILLADGIVSCAWPDEPRSLRSPDSRILMESGPLLGLLGAAVIIAALKAASFRTPYVLLLQPELYALGGILVFGGAMTAVAFSARLTGAGLSLIVITLTGALCAATWARLAAEPLRSYASLSRAIAERAPDARLICYHRYVQGLAFYTHRRVILVGPQSELKFGADHARDADKFFFTTDDELVRIWNRPGDAVLVLDAADLARLKDRLGNFTLIAVEHTKRAIVNHGEQLARR